MICGCKGKPAGMVAIEATPAAAAAEPERWTLTRPMLDGYLRYQRTLLIQAGLLKASAWDGGSLKKFEDPSVEQKASLDERARLEAGLSPDDVLKIEAMLSRVASRRLTYRLMRMDETMPEVPMPDPDDPAKTEDMAKGMAIQAKQMKKTVEDMAAEREQFGTKNIDVMLQREDELLQNWSLMMQVPELAEKRR